jgi:hypothetical protein
MWFPNAHCGSGKRGRTISTNSSDPFSSSASIRQSAFSLPAALGAPGGRLVVFELGNCVEIAARAAAVERRRRFAPIVETDLPQSFLLLLVGACRALHGFWHRELRKPRQWGRTVANVDDERRVALGHMANVAATASRRNDWPNVRRPKFPKAATSPRPIMGRQPRRPLPRAGAAAQIRGLRLFLCARHSILTPALLENGEVKTGKALGSGMRRDEAGVFD